MSHISGIDHVAITVDDIDATCAFWINLFGATRLAAYSPEGKILVQQIAVGNAVLSIHQQGKEVALVAYRPTPGVADICFRWDGDIESAMDLLEQHRIPIIEGPTPRYTAGGFPAQSIFFRDIDLNLIELMAASH